MHRAVAALALGLPHTLDADVPTDLGTSRTANLTSDVVCWRHSYKPAALTVRLR